MSRVMGMHVCTGPEMAVALNRVLNHKDARSPWESKRLCAKHEACAATDWGHMESTESVISFSIERMIRHLHGVGSVVHTVIRMGLECLGVWKHRRQTGRRIGEALCS